MEDRYYVAANNDAECWELRERGAINDDGQRCDGVLAAFYSSGALPDPMAQLLADVLNGKVGITAGPTDANKGA